VIIYENHCVGCKSIGLRCFGDSCPNRDVEIEVCDKCKMPDDRLLRYNGGVYCEECLFELLGIRVIQ
jgi:hypothetical protein